MRALAIAVLAVIAAQASPSYVWTQVIERAAFAGGYNFPVFVVRNEMWAFHGEGPYRSTDGKTWTKTELPASGLNSAYQDYVQLNDAVYALGTMQGNYQNLQLGSRISRTTDFKRWDVVAEQSNLPARVFYGSLVHQGKVWMLGGFDGRNYFNDVWSSPDAVHWTRDVEHAPWSRRDVDTSVVFKDRLWVIGGSVIDGQKEINPNSKNEVWSSADGVQWSRVAERTGRVWGGTPVVYDGKLWMIGANRNETFAPATLVTDDGITWRENAAPWPPRGAPAVWVFDGKLFMAGGKYSTPENGQPTFIYRNDVWFMTRPGAPSAVR